MYKFLYKSGQAELLKSESASNVFHALMYPYILMSKDGSVKVAHNEIDDLIDCLEKARDHYKQSKEKDE